jgi:ATP-binding cassette, subfamily B, bacterial
MWIANWLRRSVLSFGKSASNSFEHTPRSLTLAWRASPASSATIVALTLISALLPLAIAYIGKLIIDAVVAHSIALTTQWVFVELAAVGLQSLVQRVLFLLRGLLGARLGVEVNVQILDKAIRLDLAHFEDSEFYDKLTRARREASSRPVSMVTDTLQLIQNALTLLGYVALLSSFSGWAVVGLALAAVPATLVEMKFSNVAFRLRNWRSADSRRLMYVEYVIANDEHVKEVKLFNLGPLLLERYRTISTLFYNDDKVLSVRRTRWAFVLSLLALAAFYLCYLALAVNTAKGLISLGNLTLYVVAFRQGQQAFQSCLTAIGSMYENTLYMSNLFEYLDMPLPNRTSKGHTIGTTERGIRFEKVGFKYPGREPWALKGIDLFIPDGKSLALVGHNGAGKTTFIKLLCGLYEPTEGSIFIDGKEIREWDVEELRKKISVVFQDFNQYQMTFKENVGFGDLDFREDDTRIARAIHRGGADEVARSLPQGIDTPLGKWFASGVELSGGQWQKIALARAFMREDAEILILDEPTAALDAEAEYEIFERFRSLAKGKTTLLISHRFPTVRLADWIIVLENGELVEQGTHADLVNQKGRYAELFALQAKGYL